MAVIQSPATTTKLVQALKMNAPMASSVAVSRDSNTRDTARRDQWAIALGFAKHRRRGRIDFEADAPRFGVLLVFRQAVKRGDSCIPISARAWLKTIASRGGLEDEEIQPSGSR